MKKKLICLTISTFLIAFAVSAQAGTVAYYDLDEGIGNIAHDRAGNNNGIITAAALQWTTGAPSGWTPEGGYHFNNTPGGTPPGTDWIDLGPAVGSAPALTVAFWMKTDQLNYYAHMVQKVPDDASGQGWGVGLRADGKIRGYIGSGGSLTTFETPNPAVPSETWTHVALTFAAGTGNIYINGDLIITKPGIAQGVANNTVPCRLGVPPVWQVGQQYKGSLDEVRICDTALSQSEIKLIMLGKAPTPHIKWSQPPLEMEPMSEWPLYCGWNQQSWSNIPEQPLIRSAADDFRCIGPMPVTSIHWWGSYLNYEGATPPQPAPQEWLITFWSNIPAEPTGAPSHPGTLLWSFRVPDTRIKVRYDGDDFFPQMPPESCFQYNLDLAATEYFWQEQYLSATQDNTFWLGITAIYPPTVPTPLNPWGWKTRPAHWMDDAVAVNCTELPGGGLQCGFIPLESALTGESFDLAFELDTAPEWVKWEQPFTGLRLWAHYMDQLSTARQEGPDIITINRLVADDWRCVKRTPVTSIVWWGSYKDYTYQPCGTLVPNPPVKPDYFLLSIWTDVPATAPGNPYPYSHPGKKIWEYKTANYDEVLVGYDKFPENQPGSHESVFRYSVKLPKEKWFKQRRVNQIYWLSIVAVYGQNQPTYPWGWTNHKHVFNDDAVAGTPITGTNEWAWEELHDQTGASSDQSFMLFTNPNICVSCADYDWSGIVNAADLKVFCSNWLWTGPAGGLNDADLNCNGAVNFIDFAIFALQWLNSCP